LSAAGVSLGSLLKGLAAVPRDVSLTDVTLDSRQVRPGGAFLACRGERRHGLDFAADVSRRGAAAIVWESDGGRQPPRLESDIVLAEVPRLAERASLIADRFFGAPSRRLDVIGVTGTNGKTTCAWLLSQALSACDLPAAYMGTLGTAFGTQFVKGEMTTPDAVTVQRELARFAARGARKTAMEVSSHGLAQGRVRDVHFDAAVFTNLTRDHLDFHGDMQRYGAAKASLFEREDVRLRVFNVDDAFGAQLAARPAFRDRIACTRAGRVPAGRFLQAQDIRFDVKGTHFALAGSFGTAEVATCLLGEFNVDNVLAVLAVLLGSGVSLQRAVDALASLGAPSGRLEVITRAGAPLVVVDYAHTPDALEKALQVLRRHCSGRLVAVFGCGGDRDRGKRPQMGAIAARLADAVVITDDNPRTESGDAIVADILAGCAGSTTAVTVQRDRRTAISTAVRDARAGDVVLVAGKGHESVQITGTEHRPFSDQAEVRAALGAAAPGGAA
jgi:UDP-N-acetylmuramoyl-L-alanyl-D-glutamate--2,6-diaminopimelate ligase